ncbi:MAG: T9SS type A sorting domain-containing protein [Bacteroidetes bacterium]|nr:T9SS type A sorting domain-containing protein [Bacteroidota bacterium]MBT4338480.1 T9SS type A sorting domain-containing protein [Bacteroidota bacterium]MBT5528680.1 T9SS type A sorting domain-containing protein [Cytophagia bacterium]MBT6836908.1 T9SS type A sorting domain-containing protein [Bacteroidota bacterium]MBT7039027.1 T9SS type A sorting domain-containing protein [Bacteroidota bacterium]
MITRLAFCTFFLLYFSINHAQSIFQKKYGGGADEQPRSLAVTEDNGYAIVGYSTSFGQGEMDIMLSKFDSSGNILWSKTYGGESDDDPKSLINTSDGGFLIGGHTKSFGVGDYDIYVIKTDHMGDVIWQKTFGTTAEDLNWYVLETSDHNYIILGDSRYYNSGLKDIAVIQIDSDGKLMWTKLFSAHQNDWGDMIIESNDGNYFIVGATYSFGAGKHDILLIKMSSSGNILWAKVYGGNAHEYAYCIIQEANGDLLIGGMTSSFGAGMADNLLIKTDNNGVEIWTKAFGGNKDDIIGSLFQTSFSGYYLGGFTESFGAGNRDLYLAKFNMSGSLDWFTTYGSLDEEGTQINNTQLLSSNRIIISGYTNSLAQFMRTADYEYYVVKTNLSGNSGCNQKNFNPQIYNPSISTYNATSSIATTVPIWQSVSAGESDDATPEEIQLCFTSIQNFEIPKQFIRIINNPCRDILKIEMPNSRNIEYEILVNDFIGRTIYKMTNYEEQQIDVSNLRPGIYFLHFHSSEGTQILKFERQ